MSHKTVFHYARLAAQAEARILELLDNALQDKPRQVRSESDLRKIARPRRGQVSSG